MWETYIPAGGLTILAGPSGVGKTYLALAVAGGAFSSAAGADNCATMAGLIRRGDWCAAASARAAQVGRGGLRRGVGVCGR